MIKAFQKACQERASRGYVNHTATFTHTVDGLWKAQVYNSQAQAAQAMETSLRSALGPLGFSSVKVRSERLERYWGHNCYQTRWRPWNFSQDQESENQQVRFIIDVAWPGMVSIEEPDASEHRIASGTEISCPICFETRPAVALIPCGHTVCHDCATILVHSSNNRCASCRRQVTAFTEGLFIG